MKKSLKAVALFAVVAACAVPAAWQRPASAGDARLRVVASTTFCEDLAKRIGGDRVETRSVASPRFNVHFIQPKPSDVRDTAKADLFVFTGLDLEAWVDPLLEASGNRKVFRGAERNVDLSAGIPLLQVPSRLDRADGDVHAFGNPHYQLNPDHLRTMAVTMAEGLKKADPAGASEYDSRLARFLSELDVKLVEWRAAAAPLKGKEIVAYHNDIPYLAAFAGLKAEAFVEPKPGIPPTPKHLKELQDYMMSREVSGIVSPTYYPKGTLEELSRRTGAPVVYVPLSPGEVPGTEDIFSFFDTVFQTLRAELR